MHISDSPIAKPVSTRSRFLCWLSCMLFFFCIMLCAPLTYDDYEFAGLNFSSFGELIQFCLSYGNGRLLGNIFGITGNQLPVFSALCKALVLGTTVILIPEILGFRSVAGYMTSFLLTVLIDPELFAQVITWNSGFHNYVPGVFCMLLALWLLQRYSERRILQILSCFVLPLLGICSQLFIEHTSIVNVIFAALLLVSILHKSDSRRVFPAIVLLAGTLVGLALMFWIPSHFGASVNNHTSGYRSVHVTSITTFIFNCVRNALRLSNHYFGLSGVPLCAGAAISVYLTQKSRKEKFNSILYCCSIIPGIYMLVCSVMDIQGWYAEPAILHHTIAMLAVLSALATWIIALFGEKDTLFRNRAMVLIGFAIFSLLPLLIVTPIRIRVVYHSQVYIVMAFFLCLMRWAKNWDHNVCKIMTKLMAAVIAVVILSMTSAFISIRGMTQARDRYIRSQIQQGAEVIDYFNVPYDLVHDATDPLMGQYYYRTQPNDVAFNIRAFDEWMNDHLGSVK